MNRRCLLIVIAVIAILIHVGLLAVFHHESFKSLIVDSKTSGGSASYETMLDSVQASAPNAIIPAAVSPHVQGGVHGAFNRTLNSIRIESLNLIAKPTIPLQIPLVHSTQEQSKIFFISFFSDPKTKSKNKMFCDYVRSSVGKGFGRVTVLGYTPNIVHLPQRHTREYYLGSKITVLRSHLAALITKGEAREEDIVMFSDASDFVWQRDVAWFLTAFQNCGGKLCVGTEPGLWPPSFDKMYEQKIAPAGALYKYMNTGSLIGRIQYLLPFLEAAACSDNPAFTEHELFYNEKGEYIPKSQYTNKKTWKIPLAPAVYRRNDQIAMSLIYLKNASIVVTLDFKSKITQSIFVGRNVKEMRNRFKFNRDTKMLYRIEDNVSSGSLHFNGDSKVFYTNILRRKLALGWPSDAIVDVSHEVYLFNRALNPPIEFDESEIDFNVNDTDLIQKFDFIENCDPSDSFTDDLLWFD